ncbi:uncharacterized protein I303_100695 [Kwoniella dejecticola CBS 10117]|uniref:Uncharacterized protein n=1 Tax=Kwoniella dejecticola CBS 10117 TaxID=1296121 RepID=A0A1A6AFP5_9TREE|nr:uncharacterized protein I303_00699 [Kwoniella dejecticola CBS 10117]OBR88881.1 hypothetical protein I303_00699 [Kwoniella dejecticola CBS 10117]
MAVSFVGRGMWPKIFLKICKLWVYIVAVGCLVMPLVVWIIIFIENTKCFSDTMGHYLGNDQWVYDQMDGDPNAGYVGNTNIPKHLGGPVFAAAFDVAMWIIILIAICADLFWKFPICRQFLESMWADGLYYTPDKTFKDIEFFFLVANAFLKIFIVVATGSQTYTGLYPKQDEPQLDTPLFCLYATLCLAGSIPFTIIALFYILHGMKMKEYKDELAAAEAAAAAKK